MKYSYEFKRECVQMYREGLWPETPEGFSNPEDFHKEIRAWCKTEDLNGPEALKPRRNFRQWTPEQKLELVSRVLAGTPVYDVSCEASIKKNLLYSWLHKYQEFGYNGLINKKKGRKPMGSEMKKNEACLPRELNESEYEELIRLRAENAYIKAENEVIKKEIALREEKQAALLKAKKQRSSKNSGKKGTS